MLISPSCKPPHLCDCIHLHPNCVRIKACIVKSHCHHVVLAVERLNSSIVFLLLCLPPTCLCLGLLVCVHLPIQIKRLRQHTEGTYALEGSPVVSFLAWTSTFQMFVHEGPISYIQNTCQKGRSILLQSKKISV